MAERNSYDFWIRYSNLCLKCKVCPLKSIIKHIKGTSITFRVERIRSEHWPFLLSALSVDNSLTKVCFTSDLPPLDEQKELWKKRRRKKDEVYPIPYGYSAHNISDICKHTARLLTVSQTLQVLIIENLPITEEDARSLAEGLRVSKIKEFSLRSYPYPVEVIEIICRGLWESEIKLLDLSDCNLSYAGLKHVCKLVKKHQVRRAVDGFPDTLRCCEEKLVNCIGLNSLNFNGNIIDKNGVELLHNTLSDDHWIEALYLQHCNIDNDSAQRLVELAQRNIRVIDIRSNDIAKNLLKKLAMALDLKTRCDPIIEPTPLWRPKNYSKLMSSRKTKLKSKVTKKYPKLKIPRKERSSLEPAFRISYEIVDKIDTFTTAEKAIQTVPTGDCGNHNCIYELKEIIERLEYRLNQEIALRNSYMITLQKVKEEVRHYKQDRVIIDMDTYSEVKNTFEKFDRFFKMMKEFGLWELVTTVGLAQYENNRLGPSRDGCGVVEDENLAQDEQEYISPNKRVITPKTQTRCCSCHMPECVSNQKLERDSRPPNMKPVRRLSQDLSLLKSTNDESKVSKVFKDLRDQYSDDDDEEEEVDSEYHYTDEEEDLVMANGKICRYGHPAQLLERDAERARQEMINRCQGLCRAEIASSFHMVKNSQELFEKIKNALKANECFCDLIIEHPERFYVGCQFCVSKNKSCVKNVSSQTPASDLPINYSCRKVHMPTLSENVPCCHEEVSSPHNSSHSNRLLNTIPPETFQQAVNLVSREWEEHVKQNFPEDWENHAKGNFSDPYLELNNPAANVEYFPTPIVANKEYFKPKESVPTSNSDQSVGSSPDESTTMQSNQISTKQKRNSTPAKVTDSVVSSNQSIKKEKSSSIVNSFESLSSGSRVEDESGQFVANQENSSSKSYLESVSNASTDKDVKSLSELEIYDPEFKIRSESIVSAKSEHRMPTDIVDGGSSNASLGKKSSSKSSKKRKKQKKLSKQNGGGEVNASNSSVPSLSDITTVSSRSLNTDSVMGKISGSEKGLS